MATGWVDPLADVNTFEIPKHHKRGLALLMMKYLPYVLIAFLLVVYSWLLSIEEKL